MEQNGEIAGATEKERELHGLRKFPRALERESVISGSDGVIYQSESSTSENNAFFESIQYERGSGCIDVVCMCLCVDTIQQVSVDHKQMARHGYGEITPIPVQYRARRRIRGYCNLHLDLDLDLDWNVKLHLQSESAFESASVVISGQVHVRVSVSMSVMAMAMEIGR
eukprot:571360_1